MENERLVRDGFSSPLLEVRHQKPAATPGDTETQMTLSLIRKSMLALVAVSGLVAAPAFAGGYQDDNGVIFADQDYRQAGEFPRRPPHPPVIEYDWDQDQDFISPRQISRMLRHQGYVQVTEISLRGDQYRVIAVRRNGAIIKLRLDAYQGSVLSVRRVGWVQRQDFRPNRRIEPGLTIEFGFDSRR
jgi:uncharacterized membrane protein YkoI